jgi:cell division protein FtsW
MKKNKVDKPFLIIVLVLVLFGFFIFSSAALGLAARDGFNYFSTILNQFFVGIVGGLILMFVFSKVNHNLFKKYSPIILFIALLLSFAVFIPGLNIEHGGAKRWLSVAGFSFQPSELLKVSTVLFLAAWFNKHRSRLKSPFFGLISIAVIIGIASIPLLLQPDFDAIILVAIPAIAMYLVAKAPIKHALWMGIVLVVILGVIGTQFDHVRSRLTSFVDPSQNSLTSNYQIQQSLIAIGSGQITGTGFGKSVQKFKYLPEPTGDSIFAVYSEEFGFIGAIILILLYLAFAVRGFYIATHAKTMFGALFVTGIVTLFIFQSFANIASMLGLLPVLGLPLIFVSLGGTSLLVSLGMIGIILNISRGIKKS